MKNYEHQQALQLSCKEQSDQPIGIGDERNKTHASSMLATLPMLSKKKRARFARLAHPCFPIFCSPSSRIFVTGATTRPETRGPRAEKKKATVLLQRKASKASFSSRQNATPKEPSSRCLPPRSLLARFARHHQSNPTAKHATADTAEPPIASFAPAPPTGGTLPAAAAIPRLAVPLEGEGVAALPGGAARGADEVVGAVALLAEAAVLAAGGGEAAALPVLHHRLGDPLDARVVADGHVGRVHGDHLQNGTRENTPQNDVDIGGGWRRDSIKQKVAVPQEDGGKGGTVVKRRRERLQARGLTTWEESGRPKSKKVSEWEHAWCIHTGTVYTGRVNLISSFTCVKRLPGRGCSVDAQQQIQQQHERASVVMTHLVVLEGGILVDPVRVKHAHVGELGAHALLGDGPQVAHGLDLVDTVVLRLT